MMQTTRRPVESVAEELPSLGYRYDTPKQLGRECLFREKHAMSPQPGSEPKQPVHLDDETTVREFGPPIEH